MPRAKHRRKGKTRPRPPRRVTPNYFEVSGEDAELMRSPDAADLLDWHPHIQREPDPRQGELF